MAFMIDEAYLPATLTVPPMTDEQFTDFCSEHPDLFFEMTSEGELIVMPPAHSFTGAQNQEISGQLRDWARHDARGITNDSSTGYVLPNGARRSPDASWTSKDEIAKQVNKGRDGYWHLCPAFVIELRSQSDRLRTVREKMCEYIANGAQLGWLIDPRTRSVEVFRPDREPEILAGINSISGEGPVTGFVLDLQTVWDLLQI